MMEAEKEINSVDIERKWENSAEVPAVVWYTRALSNPSVCGFVGRIFRQSRLGMPGSALWQDPYQGKNFPYSFIDVGTGMRLAYKEWGCVRSGQNSSGKSSLGGPVVLLLHDVGGCSQIWEGVGRELAEAGYNAIALDCRGHGRSTWSGSGKRGGGERRKDDACNKEWDRGRYSCEILVRDVHQFIIAKDLYARPLCVLGMGMGAAVGLMLAAECPKLVGAVGAIEFGIPPDIEMIDSVDSCLVTPWWCISGLQGVEFGGIGQISAYLQSPLSRMGPSLAKKCLDLFSKHEKNWHDSRELKTWMEELSGVPGTCNRLADALVHETSSGYVLRMDPEFVFEFDIGMFKRNLERLECHVLYGFGEKSSLVERQDVCNLANISVKAESLTVEELPDTGPNFIRDACEESVDFIVDYLSGPAMGCFDVPKGDAWARTPANLGLRPLPEYASVEEARKALGPRKIPTKEDIEFELRKLRVEEGRNEDDDSDGDNSMDAMKSGSKTALSLEPMDYFGFVG